MPSRLASQIFCLSLILTVSAAAACHSATSSNVSSNNANSAIRPTGRADYERALQTPSPTPTPVQEATFGPGWKLTVKKFEVINHRLKYSIKGTYPQIENSTDPRALRFNREIKEIITGKYSYLITPSMGDLREQMQAYPNEDPLNTAEFDYEVMFATDGLISIRFHDTNYSMGAAHPGEGYFTLNYNSTSGRELRLSDLFRHGIEYLPTIEELCADDLRQRGVIALHPSSLSSYLRNHDNWNITNDSLVMNFDRCAIAACMYGELAVAIPYKKMGDILNSRGVISKILS